MSTKRRFRFQFSIAALLGIVTLVAIACASGKYYYEERMVPHRPIPWQAYSPELMERLERKGKPILPFFDADWDPTGLILRYTVLETPEVGSALYRNGLAAVYVDCTGWSPESRAALEKHLCPGQVPVVVVLRGGRNENGSLLVGGSTKDAVIEAAKKGNPY